MGKRSRLLPLLDGVARLARGRRGSDPTNALLHRVRELTFPGDASDRDECEHALIRLLAAYQGEAGLAPFGELAARWDIDRFLGNVERLGQEEARSPEILAEPIDAPMIVTGMPRSGTSFLHALLAEDPDNQAVRCWQTIYPYPDASARVGASDKRARRVDWQLRSFGLIAPGLSNIHPLDANSPQECTEITAHVFQSLRFDTTHDIPSYRAWLDSRGHRAAYRFHRRFLQHLQRQHGRKRWVLKSPDHVFALNALHQVYPDARMVFVHRDPCRILPSVANLTDVLRAPFARRTDPLKIGRQVLDDWTHGAENMVAEGGNWTYSSPEPFHVHYQQLVARPLETVQRLYRHFGHRLSEAAAERISRLANARPNGGYGKNVYCDASYGLDPDEIRERFRFYVEFFDIAQEGGRSSPPPAERGARTWTPARSDQPVDS